MRSAIESMVRWGAREVSAIRRVFKTLTPEWAVWVAAPVFVWAAAQLVIVALREPITTPWRVGAVTFAVVGLIAAYRFLRIKVIATDDGITARNILSTRFIPWDQIAEFAVRQRFGYGHVAHAVLEDGNQVQLSAIAGGNPVVQSDPAAPVLKAILELEALRPTAPPPRGAR